MKLIIMQGIQGSGKSTKARKLAKADKTEKTIIVSRDSLRQMMGTYWVASREGLITSVENYIIRDGLKRGYSVIVDATNLNSQTIKRLEKIANSEKIQTEYITLTINPLHAFIRVIWRTIKGGRFIPFGIIKGFYYRYKDIIAN